MSALLTASELELQRLTGKKQRSLQIEWLRSNGVPYRLDAGGRIIVVSAHVADWARGVQVRQPAGPRLDLVS